MRTWSWNHSRWRKFGVAAATGACRCGRAVPGDSQVVRGGDGRDAQPSVIPAAAGRVGLQAVDRAGRAHPPEVGEVVAVLAGGDVGGDRVADLAQPVEVVGGDRLLEPADVEVVVPAAHHPDGLLAPV